VTTPLHAETRRIIFVSRHPFGEGLRSARAISKLDNVCLLGICESAPVADLSKVFAVLDCVDDVHDADQLVAAARRLIERHGALAGIVTAQETLLKPVAEACEVLGLPGFSVDTVSRALDKSRLKRILAEAGIGTARDQVISSVNDVRLFVEVVGFPIVLKPLCGSGGLATWRIRNAEQMELALDLMKPSIEGPVLAEEYLRGQELCIDTITIENEPKFYSICYYRPPIMTALENSEIQWTCVMPRDISGDEYREFIEQGVEAIRALSVGNAMTHMEGFLLDSGGVRFTDATLRPAGARIGPMLAFAYDVDPYKAWARAVVDGCFDGPWERRYAVGTVFLRGMGSGTVEYIHGMDLVEEKLGVMLVDVHLPRVGAVKSATYTGDGYVTVRHPDTAVVEDALRFISESVKVGYSIAESPTDQNGKTREQWSEQVQYSDKQLYRPVWDDDSLAETFQTSS
jgi:ATP-grasp N-terminal domain/ATP-grasp domain